MIPAGDPGLQPQRTSLAWERTALALLGAGVVVALAWGRLALVGPTWEPVAWTAAGAAAVTAGLGAVTALVRRGSWTALVVVVLGVLALTVLGLLAALAGLGGSR